MTTTEQGWIRTVPVAEATGRLAEAYAWQSRTLGAPTTFTRLGSLDPEIVHARLVLYKASENSPSAITPLQRALLGYVTSWLNRTPHCVSQIDIKLHEVGADAEFVAALQEGRYDDLPPVEAALARYAHRLTLTPGDIVEADLQALRAVGLGDQEILDANNMVAHLNYTNRVANGLGLRDTVASDFAAFSAIPS